MSLRGKVVAVCWRVRALWALARARHTSRIGLVRTGRKRILVICYGNIYRSPFVAQRLRSLSPGLAVRSAGFHPQPGRTSPAGHVIMAKGYGIDLSKHVSSVVCLKDNSWADVVILMDRSNWVRLRRMGFDHRKFVWLGALAPGPLEIEDPYNLDDDSAAAVLDRMAACVERLASALKEPTPQFE